MKIAVITDDGITVSQHFGRAPYYLVFTVEDGKIIKKEKLEKAGHHQFGGESHEEHHGETHGMDEEHHNRHSQMANPIADCQVLICGGMGMGAYESMRRLNITPIVTDLTDGEKAVQLYLDGKLIDQTDRLH